MRKVVMFNRVSIDGFFAGPKGEIDWFIPDPELDKVVHELMSPDTVLLGRVTYELLANYWPKAAVDPKAPEGERKMGRELNQMNKLVFSNSLREVTWENSRLVKGNIAEEVRKLKRGDGADMVIFGSGTIVQQLTADGLIDEYLFTVTPTILGEGKMLFSGVKKRSLEPLEISNFRSGNILIRYRIKQ